MMSSPTQLRAPTAELRASLAGFPTEAVDAVLAWHDAPSSARLDAALRAVIEFYLPTACRRSLAGLPATTRLREDLGVDSLTLAEMAFKCDELFGVSTELREV